ncbi:two-component sensor histidine kinase [Inquilinus ginsengisoli]|uniref:histidine kinase n=1 Tax=Inquilinus ginsengisoli TaxID=363840 RepID=A0ABU1JVL5_9PROT|nr:histidine kinase dimerization/phosphoacceptor domain -containing protein [Inquilinus ginsengisoli]MDR6292667.1 two-component sensor histidine kinase [Inquilinus ginsengisoli]
MNLLSRLFLLVVLAVAPGIVLQGYNEYALRIARTNEIQDDAIRLANVAAGAQFRIVDGVRQLLAAMARVPAIREGQGGRCTEVVDDLRSEVPSLTAIAVVDADGNLLCGANHTAAISTSVGHQGFFQRAREIRGFAVGGFATTDAVGEKVLHVAYPIFDGDSFQGAVVAALSVDAMAAAINIDTESRSAVITITDRAGVVMSRLPGPDSRWIGRQVPEPFLDLLASPQAGSVTSGALDDTVRIYGYVPMRSEELDLFVLVGIDRAAAFATIDAATQRGIAMIVAGLLVSLAAAGIGGRLFLLRPIDRLLSAAREWQRGNLSARVPLRHGRDEFGRLGLAFDSMAEKIEQNLKQKDLLLREINHRVMNSFQLLSSLFGLQARRARTPEAKQALAEANDRIQALAIVHRRLYAHAAVDRVEVKSYLTGLCDDLSRALLPDNGAKEIVIDAVEADLPPSRIVPLGLIVNELVTNAVKYAFPDRREGRVEIGFRHRAEGGYRLTVADDGVGLPEGKPPANGTGLGMMVLQAQVRQLDAAIDIASSPAGTRFTIDIPDQRDPEA